MNQEVDAILPHGGTLIDRVADSARAAELKRRASEMLRHELHIRELADLEMIATGALSPLDGYMCEANYRRVVEDGRLANGLPWTIPITLSTSSKVAATLKRGTDMALFARPSEGGQLHAVLTVEEVYSPDK